MVFSERLKTVSGNADYFREGPTQLSREFNVRFTGHPITGHPITVHAAAKRLFGVAIPTLEKLRILSQ